jgi:hypothetical protein
MVGVDEYATLDAAVEATKGATEYVSITLVGDITYTTATTLTLNKYVQLLVSGDITVSGPLTIDGGGSASTTSNLVWVSSTSLLYHKNQNCTHVSANETLSQSTLEAAKQRNKGECPVCYNSTTYYATANGDYYHTDSSCTNMKNAVVFPKELAEAYNKDACPVCVTGEKKKLDEVNTSVFLSSSTQDKSGIKVLTVPSSELSRGRGGPRCMSCPVNRDDI